ncbi:YajD family HNH nuclease [Pseudomonas stutzeri]|uniref:Putative HNH nuclease YajD n=1 Tax=Stutzerimonas stutzeri TaxID=316 RepID=A0A2N8S2Z4_STUST|nr:YajD family HNH nuclease [Stutzerimonas stutzeri]MCQ4296570.1 YajD family HNH nuclease [Stutzerimonas stutzeri]PNF81000.1 restriction endonuclease [Stutzerimonas stutzeri]
MSTSKPATPYSQREQGYREKALKMYPWVCGRCAREFSGKRLSELTVHHKDHNHDNNPEDGSNWELLCLYCHDNEHSRYTDNQYHAEARPGSDLGPKETFKAFANLADLLKSKPD